MTVDGGQIAWVELIEGGGGGGEYERSDERTLHEKIV